MAELKLLGLSKYEISMVESMHDIAGHINNILEELPHAHILNDDEKSKIKNILEIYYREKDRKQCCDPFIYD